MENKPENVLSTKMLDLRAPLIKHAMTWAQSRADAEDLVHSAFERALARRHRLVLDERFGGWCRTVIRNLAIDRARQTKSSRRAVRDAGVFLTRPGTLDDDLPWWSGLDRRDVDEALQRCTPAEREIFELRHDLGLPFQAIADRLGINLNTATTRVCRLRARLRRELVSKNARQGRPSS
jgi:RNA polymerase sigma-70 factor (ECF subfamily)